MMKRPDLPAAHGRLKAFGLAGSLGRFVKDISAVGAIEFALIVPLLIMLYFGVIEIEHALSTKSKVTSTTSTIGDLVTRRKELDAATMTDILDWTPLTVLAPYPTTPGKPNQPGTESWNPKIKVTCIAVDEDKIATVKWSTARGTGDKDRVDSKVTPPTGVTLPNSKLVHVDVEYTYQAVIAWWLPELVTFNSDFYFKPREGGTVCYDGTCC